jgi:hypothetical protein
VRPRPAGHGLIAPGKPASSWRARARLAGRRRAGRRRCTGRRAARPRGAPAVGPARGDGHGPRPSPRSLAHRRRRRARGARARAEWDGTVRLVPPRAARARWRCLLDHARRARAAALCPRLEGRAERSGATRLSPLAGPRRTGRGTPVLVAAGDAVLAGGPGFVASRAEAAAGGVEVALLLDDADERPFSTYETCLELPEGTEAQPMHWADPRCATGSAGGARAGDEDAARATLFPLCARRRSVRWWSSRWPRGARAALVLTDHADRTDPTRSGRCWRSSDPRAEGGVGAGPRPRPPDHPHLLRPRSARRPRRSRDPAARRRPAASGSEVALHGDA